MALPWNVIIPAAVGLFTASRQRKAARRQSNQQLALQREQQAILEKQKQEYRDIKFYNPYADLQNQFRGMENVYEDLTVNQQQAQFQAEEGRRQRATILQAFKGTAGSSGVAALAQSLAQQGQLQTQQISASIGQQESMNQKLRAQGAMQIQQLERQGEQTVDMQRRAGEVMLQEAEMSRQATLLGMQYGQTAGAQSSYQQTLLNQQQANASASQMQTQAFTQLMGADWGDTFTGNTGAGNTGMD